MRAGLAHCGPAPRARQLRRLAPLRYKPHQYTRIRLAYLSRFALAPPRGAAPALKMVFGSFFNNVALTTAKTGRLRRPFFALLPEVRGARNYSRPPPFTNGHRIFY